MYTTELASRAGLHFSQAAHVALQFSLPASEFRRAYLFAKVGPAEPLPRMRLAGSAPSTYLAATPFARMVHHLSSARAVAHAEGQGDAWLDLEFDAYCAASPFLACLAA